MHQNNTTPNRVAFAEVQRQLKEATGGLDADVGKILPIKLRREWIISMTRFAATITNNIWEAQEAGTTNTRFLFNLEKFPNVPAFNLGAELKIQIDLVATDTPVKWSDCVWQPSE